MAASEHQERLNRLRESVDASARNLRVVYVSFLLIALYLVEIISSTTHEDLFYANDVVMPIVNIGVPIVWFYAVVPGLFLLLHFNLLIQFYFLSHKVIAFEQALGDGGTYGGKSYGGEPYQAEQRGALFPSPFSHLLAGSHYSTPFRILLGIFVFVSTIVLPLSILLYAQIKFPPYQDDGITWAHRGVIGIDLALVAIYLPIIHSGSQVGWMQALNFWRHPVSRIIPCSAILFWIVFVAETAGGPVERWTGFKEISDASVGVIFSRTFDFHDLVLVAEPPPPEILAAYIAKWQATKAEKGGEAWELENGGAIIPH